MQDSEDWSRQHFQTVYCDVKTRSNIQRHCTDIWEFASTSRNLDMLLALQAGWEIKFAKIKIQSNGWEDLFKETYGLKVFTTRNKDTYTQNQSRFISIINKVLSQLSILFLAKIVTNFAFWSSTTPWRHL